MATPGDTASRRNAREGTARVAGRRWTGAGESATRRVASAAADHRTANRDGTSLPRLRRRRRLASLAAMQVSTLLRQPLLAVRDYRCAAGPSDLPFVECFREHS